MYIYLLVNRNYIYLLLYVASGIHAAYVQELVHRDQDKAMLGTQMLGERRKSIDECRCRLRQMDHEIAEGDGIHIKLV